MKKIMPLLMLMLIGCTPVNTCKTPSNQAQSELYVTDIEILFDC